MSDGFHNVALGRHWSHEAQAPTIIPGSENRPNSPTSPNSRNQPHTSAYHTVAEAVKVEPTQHKDGPWRVEAHQTQATQPQATVHAR